MKVVCISDTHRQLEKVKVPLGDLLIHAGDLTGSGSEIQIISELDKLKDLSKGFSKVILISGNHDWLGERQPDLMRQLCKSRNITYLCHESTEFEGLNIFGSPYTPEFCNWAFNVPRGKALKDKWDQIPLDTNILVTHGPPYGVLDQLEDGARVGCQDLANRIKELKSLKLHVFGHSHSGYGSLNLDGVKYVNASICDEQYQTSNKPIIKEI